MFKSIKGLFKRRKSDRTRMEEVIEEREAAEHFRDLVGVAWKLDFPVFITIQVNGVEASVCVRGPREGIVESIYNFAAGQALRLSGEQEMLISMVGGEGSPGKSWMEQRREAQTAKLKAAIDRRREWERGKTYIRPDRFLNPNGDWEEYGGYWVNEKGSRVEEP